MLNLFRKIIDFFENQPINFNTWSISFFSLLALNLFFQFITYGFKNISAEQFIGEFIQPYYFILYFSIVIFLYTLIKNKKESRENKNNHFINPQLQNTASFVLWGFWSIIFWPIIDKIILKNNFHLSFYLYDSLNGIINSFFSFFGPINPVGILYGTRIETIFIILITAIYVFSKNRKISTALIAGVGVYTIFFITVSFPSIITFIINFFQGHNVNNLTNLDVVALFNTPLKVFGLPEKSFASTFFYKISLIYNIIFIILLIWFQKIANPQILKALLKNIRIPQMIFNWGLLMIGIITGLFYFPENLSIDFFSGVVLINLFLSILFIWLFSVVVNDIEDYQIDKISNKNRPLTTKVITKKEYTHYGIIFLFLSYLLAISISGEIFLLIVSYSLITFIYSKYPFKLKRMPWISGIISSLASLLIFLSGYLLISSQEASTSFPWLIVLYLFISYALILPIKDLKDIKSDKKNNVLTIANLLGEKNARIYFASIIFLLYIGSVLVFHNKNLFFPATTIAILNYWIITNKKNSRNKLFYKIIFLVIVYITFIISI